MPASSRLPGLGHPGFSLHQGQSLGSPRPLIPDQRFPSNTLTPSMWGISHSNLYIIIPVSPPASLLMPWSLRVSIPRGVHPADSTHSRRREPHNSHIMHTGVQHPLSMHSNKNGLHFYRTPQGPHPLKDQGLQSTRICSSTPGSIPHRNTANMPIHSPVSTPIHNLVNIPHHNMASTPHHNPASTPNHNPASTPNPNTQGNTHPSRPANILTPDLDSLSSPSAREPHPYSHAQAHPPASTLELAFKDTMPLPQETIVNLPQGKAWEHLRLVSIHIGSPPQVNMVRYDYCWT